jgi:hypothetical protein
MLHPPARPDDVICTFLRNIDSPIVYCFIDFDSSHTKTNCVIANVQEFCSMCRFFLCAVTVFKKKMTLISDISPSCMNLWKSYPGNRP